MVDDPLERSYLNGHPQCELIQCLFISFKQLEYKNYSRQANNMIKETIQNLDEIHPFYLTLLF